MWSYWHPSPIYNTQLDIGKSFLARFSILSGNTGPTAARVHACACRTGTPKQWLPQQQPQAWRSCQLSTPERQRSTTLGYHHH
jgi:hypothetical protein